MQNNREFRKPLPPPPPARGLCMNRLSAVDADACGIDQEFVHHPMTNSPDASYPARQRAKPGAETGQLGKVTLDAAALVVQVVSEAADGLGDLQQVDRAAAVRGDVMVPLAGARLGARAEQLMVMLMAIVEEPTG